LTFRLQGTGEKGSVWPVQGKEVGTTRRLGRSWEPCEWRKEETKVSSGERKFHGQRGAEELAHTMG
jgi:hypothetical protein